MALNVIIDDLSGEDGAPMPTLTYYLQRDLRLPHPDSWAGLEFHDREDKCCESWLGNDAPAIKQNKLVFGDWLGRDSVRVDWSGPIGCTTSPAPCPMTGCTGIR